MVTMPNFILEDINEHEKTPMKVDAKSKNHFL